MKNSLIDRIITRKKKCYFISPHLDDAVLSAGALIAYLAEYTDVTVVNVFTKAGVPPYTLSAKQYLKICGFEDAEKLFSLRKKEDMQMLSNLGVRTLYLDLIDALWRRKKHPGFLQKMFEERVPEVSHVYPTYRFNITSGKISVYDTTYAYLKKKLQNIDIKSIIFCPAAIDNHVDHVIVRNICRELFPNIIYWSDFPYNKDKETPSFFDEDSLSPFLFTKNKMQKLRLVKSYKIPFGATLGAKKSGLPDESYYYSQKLKNI